MINLKDWRNFYIPIAFYAISYLIDSWPLAVFCFIVPFLFIKKEYLFVFYVATSFFNIMNIENISEYGSIVTSYGALILIIGRLNKFSIKNRLSLYLGLAAIVIIILNFTFLTIGEYFIRTGLKSSIQLIFIVSISILLGSTAFDTGIKNRNKFDEIFIFFLVPYLVVALLFFDERYGGFVGAQAPFINCL